MEDSPLIRMGAVELVLSAGYEALEAGDADEAIRILESRDEWDRLNWQLEGSRLTRLSVLRC